MKKSSRKAVVYLLAAPATMALSGITETAYATEGDDASVLTAGCPSYERFNNNYVCTSLSSGALFHPKGHSGATATSTATKYTKLSGSSITAKLGYTYKGTTYWGGTFTQASGTTKTNTWTRNDYDWVCNSTFMNVSGQGNFQTPVASC
ncbi:hypothetical protein OG322_40155 [Streptomyces sp. NBC_01260]|uniref:hypothetical protein n=1 Tax=unclassified Streptomyces TaxID=2593676 RepID=UPI0022542912|nr:MULTISPECIES: hypothetical protein [unclassified Streptomyces]MCX4774912.1 hypothetical protein [Streptomyces sp. NBC_01285]